MNFFPSSFLGNFSAGFLIIFPLNFLKVLKFDAGRVGGTTFLSSTLFCLFFIAAFARAGEGAGWRTGERQEKGGEGVCLPL